MSSMSFRPAGLLALPVAAIMLAAPAFAADFKAYEKAAFDRLVATGAPVLVHVHADWCPTCRRQEAVFKDLLADTGYAGISRVRVDFDKDTEFRAANKVNNQSVLIVFKGGREVARSAGQTGRAEIAALVDRIR
jgi:thiol-disulfide isomerase/thioredoxin